MLGRIGSRPLNEAEQRAFFLDKDGSPWFVTDEVDGPRGITSPVLPRKNNRTFEQQRAEMTQPAGSPH